MADIPFEDKPQTVELLRSIRTLMRWLSSLPRAMRQRFLRALAESSDQAQEVVFRMVSIMENPGTTKSERRRALTTIAGALSLNPDDEAEYDRDRVASEANATTEHPRLDRPVQKADCQESVFADRLRKLMDVKRVTQEELCNRVGCSQPAISQMLNRKCRPQKKTIFKLADALQVPPQELWPDIEVAEMLDAVASFQHDEHVITEAEAKALRDPGSRNVPRIPARSLPGGQRRRGKGMTDHPHQLYAIEFDGPDQARLAGFSCGGEAWSRHVAQWIRGSDVLDSMKKGTKVWLFENADSEIVGFGSLGRTRWRWPLPDGSDTSILLIPMLGLGTRFQGQPPDPDWRFARQIMSHLLNKALEISEEGRGRLLPSTGWS